ncbi:S-layer homology domain-containing protein [Colibacter massiliensis]|uniref:S-layer homology domain-containing protein n=2 Tax=Colibacter massiliensis TaxID=1852379 RepID=UPI002356F93E|nr:S-layer homology domain-containing protein [Colibacter massiliensis]
MKKKVLATLVATMAVGATAFAANPFVDVPADSWAYNSVVELANSGIIQGVDGVHFEGDRNITRYEAAEIVAKAMAHEDRANAEQRALINKLADEFSDELNNLGVRVSNLEERVGNVKLTGDARIRYMHQNDNDKNKALKNDKSWQFRTRLRANARINDRATAVLGVNFNTQFSSDAKASDDNDKFFVDRAYVDYKLGGDKNWDVMVGRYDYELGNASGIQFGDNFDGAQLKYANDKFAATAGYGKFKEGNLNNVKTGYGELEGFFGGGSAAGSALGAYYNSFHTAPAVNNDRPDDLWGAYASINFGKKWNVFGEYEKVNNMGSTSDADVFLAKLQYGKAKFTQPKSWDLWVDYLNAEKNGIYGSTGNWRTDALLGKTNGIETWGVGADYTFAKNAQFQVFQSFSSKAKDDTKDPEELTRAQFVFVF